MEAGDSTVAAFLGQFKHGAAHSFFAYGSGGLEIPSSSQIRIDAMPGKAMRRSQARE
jgi:hypothetical protein